MELTGLVGLKMLRGLRGWPESVSLSGFASVCSPFPGICTTHRGLQQVIAHQRNVRGWRGAAKILKALP
jgi:hypothetical protein